MKIQRSTARCPLCRRLCDAKLIAVASCAPTAFQKILGKQNIGHIYLLQFLIEIKVFEIKVE